MTVSLKYNYFIDSMLNVCHISFLPDFSKSDQRISNDIDSVVKTSIHSESRTILLRQVIHVTRVVF